MDLSVQNRDEISKNIKEVREKGYIAAEFYGHKMDNKHLAVKKDDFRKAYKEAGESSVINLVLDGKKMPALIHEVQQDYVSGETLHIDFYGVRMDEKLTAGVALEFVGEAPAVKTYGGVVNKSLQEVEVEALPSDLPHSIKVDLSVLTEIGQSIYIKDLALPKGVEVLVDPETVVVGIAAPRAEEETPVAPIDISEVKVESEEKKAEREAKKAESADAA
jgi:large subunit ribosomal protein L25